jgi:hypothetical protein
MRLGLCCEASVTQAHAEVQVVNMEENLDLGDLNGGIYASD